MLLVLWWAVTIQNYSLTAVLSKGTGVVVGSYDTELKM